MLKKTRPHLKKGQTVLWSSLFLFTVVLQILSRKADGFAEWYAKTVYPLLMRLLGSLSGLFPFAVDELAAYVLAAAALVYLAAGVRGMAARKIKPASWAGRTAVYAVKAVIIVFLLFTTNSGINYHRTPFSVLADLPVEQSTTAELEGLCLWLTGRIEEESGKITLQENGLCALPDQMREKTRAAMMDLGETYPQLGGWYPKAKPVFTWPVLSYEFLEGIYGPYTMEANYNPDIPRYNQPAVLCHELSHLKGFMREDEANYIAYLACTGSKDANLRYSGLLLAYTHSMNALYGADYERFLKVRGELCEQANLDYAYHGYYWDRYEGPVSELSDKVNDTYLKANAQPEGSRSYGKMVDLLIGEYRKASYADKDSAQKRS